MKPVWAKSGIWTCLLLGALATVPAPAARAEFPATSRHDPALINPKLAHWLDATAQKAVKADHLPGLAVGIVIGSTLAFEGYYGYADLGSRRPVDENTFFRIASISKTFTAVGLMQQWEQGRFRLDDDINDYISGPGAWPPHPDTNPVTFRSLLTHSSGGGEFVNVRHLPVIYDGLIVRPRIPGRRYPEVSQALARHHMRYRIEPGQKYAYCNFGFLQLGAALETMTGEPFPEYQQKNVLDRLGMAGSSYRHDARIMETAAVGYLAAAGVNLPTVPFVWDNTPAAGILTTVRDMAKYLAAMVNGGANQSGRVVKPETLALMLETHFTRDPRQGGYGLGFRSYGRPWGRGLVVGHGGNYLTQVSQMLLAPEDRTAVFAVANSSSDAPNRLAWKLLAKTLGVKDRPLPEIEPEREAWAEFTGVYTPKYHDFNTSVRLYESGDIILRVVDYKGELKVLGLFDLPSRAPALRPADPDDPGFFEKDDPGDILPRRVAFTLTPAGEVIMVPGGLNEYLKQ